PAPCHALPNDVADLQLSATVIESYDDNITFAQSNAKSDSLTSVIVALEAIREEKLKKISLGASIAHNFYQTYSDFDNTAVTLTGSLQQEFDKYSRISLRDAFRHADEPASFEDEFGRTAGRYSYYRNNLDLEYTHDFTRQFTMIARASNEVYDVNRNDLSDSYLYRLGLEGDYALSSQAIVYGLYDVYRREFDPGQEALFNLLAAGSRYYFTSQLSCDARAGVNFINSYDEKDYTKPSLFVSITDEFDAASRATLSVVREYSANRDTQDLFDYWQANASFTRQAFERLRASLNAFYGKGTYDAYDIEDTLQGAGASFEYDLLHNARLVLRYTYSRTESNVTSREYKRNFYSGGISIRF
ncbi:MAG: hypothetical protein PHT59_06975, partial [Candidatus Omnitrophica bacterium]|nr:hypothetical protein [Candidatus Omnitrophota bacterium]